jgi:hypothetical protein
MRGQCCQEPTALVAGSRRHDFVEFTLCCASVTFAREASKPKQHDLLGLRQVSQNGKGVIESLQVRAGEQLGRGEAGPLERWIFFGGGDPGVGGGLSGLSARAMRRVGRQAVVNLLAAKRYPAMG